MESGQLDSRGLLVAVDASLDGVALLVSLAVKGWWPTAPATAPEPVSALVRWDRNHRPDAAVA